MSFNYSKRQQEVRTFAKLTPEQKAEVGKLAAEHLYLTRAKQKVQSRGIANNKWVWQRSILGLQNLFPQNVQYDQTMKIICLGSLALYGKAFLLCELKV